MCACVRVRPSRLFQQGESKRSEVPSLTQRQEGSPECGTRLEGRGEAERQSTLIGSPDGLKQTAVRGASETTRSEGPVCTLNCFKRRNSGEKIGLFSCLLSEQNCVEWCKIHARRISVRKECQRCKVHDGCQYFLLNCIKGDNWRLPGNSGAA